MSLLAATSKKTLLRVTVSRRGSKSHTLAMLEEFTEHFKAKYPGCTIVDRATFDVPHIDFDNLEAGRTSVSKHTPDMVEAFKLASELTKELAAADHVVIATPMYNWGMPSSLKAWFDRVINTHTFYEKTITLAGTPISLIIASGGGYSEAGSHGNAERMKMDHLRPHLLTCLTQIGSAVDDIKFIDIDPTAPIDLGIFSRDDPEKSGIVRGRQLLSGCAGRAKGDAASGEL